MEGYLLFTLVAILTICSPGPSVILTLTNAIRYGVSGALGGILGLATGIFIIAGISATGMGVLLATSATAFTAMKFIGATYLIYLGFKLWRSPATEIDNQAIISKTKKANQQFINGLILQITNPKVVFFFMSIFPQFVDYSSSYSDYMGQFTLLIFTYSTLVILIHFLYASLAKQARGWLSSKKGGTIVNRVGGGAFVFFGIGLASANR